MNLKDFLKTRPLLTNILLVILFFIVISYIALLFLKVYTHHGQSLIVPNYKGLSHNEVESLTRKNHLRYQVVDSVYIFDAKPGSVIDQYPSPGNKVKQKRIINLTIASITPEIVPIPKVIDVSLREAQSRLENSGFKIGQITYRPSEFNKVVLEQRFENRILPVGTMLPKGTPVDLIVGKGLSNERSAVPNLFSLTLNEATSQLYDLNLNTGALVYDNSVLTYSDSLNARVWKQTPDSIKIPTVEQGTSFNLWLTIDVDKLFPDTGTDSITTIE